MEAIRFSYDFTAGVLPQNTISHSSGSFWQPPNSQSTPVDNSTVILRSESKTVILSRVSISGFEIEALVGPFIEPYAPSLGKGRWELVFQVVNLPKR